MIKKTIVLGSPRSGTTWLAKLIDSHPDVLYRHEPDVTNRNTEIPFHPSKEDVEQYIDITKDYLNVQLNSQDLRTAFKLPIFKKQYRNELQRITIFCTGFVLRLFEKLLGKRLEGDYIPDFIQEKYKNNVVYAIKSVDSQCRAYLYSKADPELKIIYIIRNPCGIVASQLRGIKKGIMANNVYLKALFNLDETQQFSFDLETMEQKTIEEQIAFQWMILNEKVYNEMADNPSFKIIKYEDLCTDTVAVVKDIFEHMNLSWNEQTSQFISKLENIDNSNVNYFSVYRSPSKAAFKWKDELTDQQIERIKKMVEPSKVGKMYF